MNWISKNIKKILSIIGFIMGVGFNIPHMVQTYQMIDTKTSLPFIYVCIMVGVIDFTILVLAINEDKEKRLTTVPAVAFAWVVFALNLYLYWIAPIEKGTFLSFEFVSLVKLLPGLLFAAIPAYIIYYFSEMISDQFRPELADNSRELEMIRYELGNLSLAIDNNRSVIDIFKPLLASYSTQVGKSIKVEGVKAKVCNCGVLHVAGSNREGDRDCHNCGETIKWN